MRFKGQLTLTAFTAAILMGCGTYRNSSSQFRGPSSYGETGHSFSSNAGPSLSWPVQDVRITQKFSPPKNPRHNGIDLGGPKGTKILSSHQGRVIYAGRGFRGYGKMVMVESRYGWTTLYAHLSKISVKQGQYVQGGDLVGLMGRTGRATGVHLHFELMKNKVPVDPMNHLPDLSRIAGK